MNTQKTKHLLCITMLIGLFLTQNNVRGQEIDLAGKTYVIEGLYRGFHALNQDTIQLVQRHIPRAHDYLEFYTDSTFHFNYRQQQAVIGNQPYQKVNWAPGHWTFNSNQEIVTLIFDDDKIQKRYTVRLVSPNIVVLKRLE